MATPRAWQTPGRRTGFIFSLTVRDFSYAALYSAALRCESSCIMQSIMIEDCADSPRGTTWTSGGTYELSTAFPGTTSGNHPEDVCSRCARISPDDRIVWIRRIKLHRGNARTEAECGVAGCSQFSIAPGVDHSQGQRVCVVVEGLSQFREPLRYYLVLQSHLGRNYLAGPIGGGRGHGNGSHQCDQSRPVGWRTFRLSKRGRLRGGSDHH